MLKNPAYKGQAGFGKTRSLPRPARLRPVRGASATPRRSNYPAGVAPEEWITVPVPAIVDADLFDVVQDQLAENRRRARSGGRGERYLLQGLVVCRVCGYAYCGRKIRRKVGNRSRTTPTTIIAAVAAMPGVLEASVSVPIGRFAPTLSMRRSGGKSSSCSAIRAV